MPEMVIIDRDGVINQESDDYIKSPDEWIREKSATLRKHRINWSSSASRLFFTDSSSTITITWSKNESTAGRKLASWLRPSR